MIYFIPAWYHENSFGEHEQQWYKRKLHTEFDDTVKQIQLFHRNQLEDFQILMLSFAPNLRHFLHRQSVFHAPYQNLFDMIQEVDRTKMRLLSYHDLKWPEDTEFVQSAFAIIALQQGQKFAQIEFGEDGNMIEVNLFDGNQMVRHNIYDDRGFLSSSVVYQDGKPIYQDYLMESGARKMRHFFQDNHVEISENTPTYTIRLGDDKRQFRFLKLQYESPEEVLLEVFDTFMLTVHRDDLFCLAMHTNHNRILKRLIEDQKVIVSFFENRYDEDFDTHRDEFLICSYLVADSRTQYQEIRNRLENYRKSLSDDKRTGRVKLSEITPYDCRVDFGISQQLTVQRILLPIDGLELHTFAELIVAFTEYMGRNSYAELHLYTKEPDYFQSEKVLNLVENIYDKYGYDVRWLREMEDTGAENDVDEEEHVSVRIFVDQCVDELETSQTMHTQRILVDCRPKPDLYLQIAAISAGIPQILRSPSQYVRAGANGYIVEDIPSVINRVSYYLDDLSHWNEAKAACFEVGKEYTTEQLVEKWREVIRFVRDN